MGKAIQFLCGVGILLCGLSVVLALTNSIAPSNAAPPPLALDALLPFQLPASIDKAIAIAVLVAIAVMFWCSTTASNLETPRRHTIVLLASQTLFAFLVAEELQFVVAVEAGLLLGIGSGSIWVFAQAAAAWLIAVLHPQLMAWIIPQTVTGTQRLIDIGIFMLVAMLYNFLAFAVGLLAAAEGRQRRALEIANGELRAMQQRAEEAARLQERLRISRELHDAIGHQLSALSIQLQIASRLTKDQARRHVLQAYQLAGLLISDVRAVVSASRDAEVTDFPQALREIASRVQTPRIHLDLESVPPNDHFLGHALFRCAQEIITNAVRHSGANNIWISTTQTAEDFRMTAWDNGCGNPAMSIGNGLAGIEERLRELSGNCAFHNREGGGFEIAIRIPLAGRTAA